MTSARTPEQTARLERLVGLVLRGGVLASSVCMSVGLVLSLAGVGTVASVVLNTGIIVLLATPVSRVVISTVEYLIERDFMFATLTFIVLLELVASALAALVFNKKL